VTRGRFLNRRQLTRTPPTEVVNCGLPVAAVHAGFVTYIYTPNDFRGITNARPLAKRSCLDYERECRHVHHVRFGSETISMASESDFLPARHPMRWIMICNGANVWLLPAVRHALTWPRDTAEKRCNHPESESLFNEETPGELRLTRASSPSVDDCLVGKVEGMCKLLPRTMQSFALTKSGAFSGVVLIRTKCFRKLGEGGSHWVLLAPFSGP
jgi:hypothetical protein